MRTKPAILRIACCLSLALLSGCTLGPRQIDKGKLEYNEAVQGAFQQEMLLNLVRLKYRETPEFLKVGGIAAQYTFEGSAGSSLTLPEGGTKILGLNGGVKRSERPTISYVPARGESFQKGLLAPIHIETLQLLCRTGWSWDRIFRTTVQYMNCIDNATPAGGPTPKFKPDYEQFHYLSKLFRELQTQRGIEFATAEEEIVKRIPVSIQLDGEFFRNAINDGYNFRDCGDGLCMVKTSTFPALIVHPDAKDSDEMRDIADLLHLDKQVEGLKPAVFKVTSSKEGWINPAYSNNDDNLGRKDIVISTRSLLEVMYYLSQGVNVPHQHIVDGRVTLTVEDATGIGFDWREMSGDLFQVHSCEKRPANAFVSVEYEGTWFYIDERDLNTQSTFTLLVELFGIEVRSGGGGGFLYTLNVGS